MNAGAGFHDDETVTDDEIVYRRIVPRFVKWNTLDARGEPAVPSQGFQDYPEERARAEFDLPGACMSVELASILAAEGLGSEDLLKEYGGYGLVAMQVGRMRSLTGPQGEPWGQGVMRDPRPHRPWHAVSFTLSGGKKTKGMQSALSSIATWVILPQALSSS